VPLRVEERYVDRFEGVWPAIRHFWNQIWIARRWVSSFWEVTVGSLFVARTAVSPVNVAMGFVGEVGRSAVYTRYNSGPTTLAWSTPA
jgi:hypothetical protein